MAGAAVVVGDSAELEEVLSDGVAPDDGVVGLVLKAREHVGVEFRIDAALQRRPVRDELCGLRGAVVVRVVEILDDGFAVVKLVSVGHVVEEEEQVVWSGGGGLVDLRDFW